MADVHAHDDTAANQKSQQVTQIELVVDTGNQQYQQGGNHQPTRFGGQNVDVALRQRQGVRQREA